MSSGLFHPRDGLRPAFHAGRPRIKCNNASSSGWRARIHLSLTRVEAHDCVPGMRDDYFVRNAPWRPYAKTGASQPSWLCLLQPPFAAKKHSSSLSFFRFFFCSRRERECRIQDTSRLSFSIFFHCFFPFLSSLCFTGIQNQEERRSFSTFFCFLFYLGLDRITILFIYIILIQYFLASPLNSVHSLKAIHPNKYV